MYKDPGDAMHKEGGRMGDGPAMASRPHVHGAYHFSYYETHTRLLNRHAKLLEKQSYLVRWPKLLWHYYCYCYCYCCCCCYYYYCCCYYYYYYYYYTTTTTTTASTTASPGTIRRYDKASSPKTRSNSY